MDASTTTHDIYAFHATAINGEEISLAQYRGKTLLIVNVASKCGFTPQYSGLQKLYENYQNRGLAVLGFPCNQFGKQEPGDANDIKTFCDTKFHVTFPMFSKIEVNGKNAHPLFTYLKAHAKGMFNTEAIKWNFTKFLVDKHGNVLKRYAPNTSPASIEQDIVNIL